MVIDMAGGKDKDLMADGCGLTKKRQYGQNKRPPRTQQRKNQRERFLNKEEKKDMLNDIKKQSNEMQDAISAKHISSFKDLVDVPQYVQDMCSLKKDANIELEESLNDIGGGFDVQVNQYKEKSTCDFDLSDINIEGDQYKDADVSNDDIILSEQEQTESDPFADLLPADTEEQVDETAEQSVEQEEEQSVEQEENAQGDTNDSIDEYLTMEIDDSKLSEQNKEKLDAFTSEQLDAFKKFLYQKKNQDK